MKKRFFLGAASLLGIVLVLSGCAFQNVGTFEEPSKSETSKLESVEVGQTINQEDFEITLESARFSKSDTLGLKPEYGTYLVLQLLIKNLTDEPNSISSLLSFELQGSDAFKYQQSLSAKKKGSLDGSIAAGSALRGEIAFDVPDLDSYTLSFKNSLFADQVSFQIESTKIK